MPYIESLDRVHFEHAINDLVVKLTPDRAGDINYVISSIVWRVLKRKLNYQNANTVIGVLESLKLELYRRLVVPYEDKKIQENGDV